MSHVLVDLIISVVAGLIGGYAAGLVGKEHSLGTVKNLVIGAIGGAGSYFLRPLIPTVVGSNGETAVEHWMIVTLLELAGGAILALVLGFVATEAVKHKSS